MVNDSRVSKSVLSRSMKLLLTASRVAGKEIGHRWNEKEPKSKNGTLNVKGIIDNWSPEIVKTRMEQAQLIADALSQLKGAAMKAGQLLSLDASDFLPPEAVKILSKLQSRGESVAFSTIEDVLKEEIGQEKIREFKEIDPLPLASASIGQVHRAKLKDENVVLKVQYADIERTIDSDVRILRSLAQGLAQMAGKDIDLKEIFEEITLVLKLETDYQKERENLDEYRQRLSGEKDYVVPRSYPEFSTRRVLCMSYEPGLTLSEWKDRSPNQEKKEAIAKLVLDLYCMEFFSWGFVQTDPNFGNFLIRENPLRLVTLDFGASIKYGEEFRSSYRKLLRFVPEATTLELFKEAVEFGLVDARESLETQNLFREMMLVSIEPFYRENQPFDFSSQDYSKKSRDAVLKFTKNLKYSPPPRQIIFLHRKLGGVFNLLKFLGVKLDIFHYWEQMTSDEK